MPISGPGAIHTTAEEARADADRRRRREQREASESAARKMATRLWTSAAGATVAG
eukprot:SAG31_NODE_35637_length_321_cov_0.756757_1_plen_54_part_01